MGPNRNFNLAIGRAKLRGSAKLASSVADSGIRWAELVPSRTVLTLSVQNGQACSKSALEKLGPIWPLGSIWLFSFYSAVSIQASEKRVYLKHVCLKLYKYSKEVLYIYKMLCLFGNKLDISTSSYIYMKQVLYIKEKSYVYQGSIFVRFGDI